MVPIAVGWVAFGIAVAAALFLNYIIVKYYSDKHESERLTTIVAVVGLTLTLLCLFIIPIDILNVSTMSNQFGNMTIPTNDINFRNDSVRIVYYVLYALILTFALIIIPFTYFYYEEYDESLTTCQRVFAGCKYTTFLVVFTIVLLVVGAFIRPGTKPIDNQNVKDWIQDEILNQNAAESSLMFSIACLTVLGFIVWITYTAFGLSAMPMGLIKGRPNEEEYSRQHDDDGSRISHTRERANYYGSKHASGRSMSARDEANLSLLQSREKALHSRESSGSSKGLGKLLIIFRPFTFIFGFIFLLLSFLIVISVVLSIVDKLSSSICGSACGFLTTYPKLKNPIDLGLSYLAPYFPLDFVLLGLLICYLYFSTMTGIVRIGIRFIWIKMFEFTPRRTAPQGLLIAAVLLMLSNLCMNVQILSLAPQYGMFGSQVWYNSTSDAISPCSLDAPPNVCVMSQIGVLSTRIQMGTSFFGIIFYYATWVFVGTFLIGTIVSTIMSRRAPKKQTNHFDDY